MPSLFVVATPIGNLEDITLRALRVLREVKVIAAEDSRTTKNLLKHYDISTPLTSYHEHNKYSKLNFILNRLVEGDVALVSEAGMPGLSDPGYELICAALESDFPVIVVPGPSAILTALISSGLSSKSFIYLGFLSRRSSGRKKSFESVKSITASIILLEAPHRLRETLEDAITILGDRQIAVCRELTKIHEEVFRGTISGALSHFLIPRGEFTIVIAGDDSSHKAALTADVETKLYNMYRAGKSAKTAITAISEESGLSRRELYKSWLTITKAKG